jgi:hypothetical protein
MTTDGDYFSRRAEEERKAADSAAHPNARQVHLDLAKAYEFRARVLLAEERRSAMRVVRAA